jgi:hypothetical protein
MANIPTLAPVLAYISKKQNALFDFELYPELWRDKKMANTYYRSKKWLHVYFTEDCQKLLPKSPGIYMFVVAPRHAYLRDHTYIFYVGQTDNIYRRFGEYHTEKKGERISADRERVVRFLNHFNGHIYFNYVTIPEAELDKAEDLLVDHIKPWANIKTKIKAKLAEPQLL